MAQEVIIFAPSSFESVRKQWKPVEGSLVVAGLSQFLYCAVVPLQPRRVNRDGPDRIAEDFTNKLALLQTHCLSALSPQFRWVHPRKVVPFRG